MNRVRPERLAGFAGDVLAAVGVPAPAAAFVADCLVQAELWGHPSHGVLRLSWYLARIRSGVVDPAATPETVVDGGAVAVVDGREGSATSSRPRRPARPCAGPRIMASAWSASATPTTSGWRPTTPG